MPENKIERSAAFPPIERRDITLLRDITGVTLVLRGSMLMLFNAIEALNDPPNPRVGLMLEAFKELDTQTHDWLKAMLADIRRLTDGNGEA